MKSIIYTTLVFILVFLNSCDYIPGSGTLSGEIVTEIRETGPFHGLNVGSGIKVMIRQGDQEAITVKADRELMDEIETEVEDGILRLRCERRWWKSATISVDLTFTELDQIRASAGSNVSSGSPVAAGELEVHTSSGSEVNLSVNTGKLDLSASSGSHLTLEGITGQLFIDASSGSQAKLDKLASEDAEAECSSGANIQITVSRTANVRASSGGHVNVFGNPEKQEVSTSSGGDVNFM
jgi:hypothetical protein